MASPTALPVVTRTFDRQGVATPCPRPADPLAVTRTFDAGRATATRLVVPNGCSASIVLSTAPRQHPRHPRFRCLDDFHNQRLVQRPVEALVRQRVMGLCLGYGDLNDHDVLSLDPLSALACGKGDVEGTHRVRERGPGRAGPDPSDQVGPSCGCGPLTRGFGTSLSRCLRVRLLAQGRAQSLGKRAQLIRLLEETGQALAG